MTAQDPRRHGPEDPNADQLPRVEVLHHPAVDRVVRVVDGMDVAVEEAVVVVDDVPGVEHGIHDDEGGVVVPDELDDPGSQRRQTGFRRPDALGDGNREHVEHLVPTGERHCVARDLPGDGDVRLDLAAPDPAPVAPEVIEERVGNQAGEEGQDADGDREERGTSVDAVPQEEFPYRLEHRQVFRIFARRSRLIGRLQ